MLKYSSLLLFAFIFLFENIEAQSSLDSTQLKKEFVSLDEALKNPNQVYRLNLSNQTIQIPDTIWAKFTNLEYLSLKNDHLKQVPAGIGYIKTLKVLDLSGNDFKMLPLTFGNLSNLQELFINDDKYFDLEGNIETIDKIATLTSLHIENNGLKSLPKNIFNLHHIESLYLNNNKFKQLPTELNKLDNLKYLDLQDNKLRQSLRDPNNQGFRFKVNL